MKFKFDPKHKMSYGYHLCPDCGSQFYGGGPAIHEKDCPHKGKQGAAGYEPCIYGYGPNDSQKEDLDKRTERAD